MGVKIKSDIKKIIYKQQNTLNGSLQNGEIPSVSLTDSCADTFPFATYH